MSPCDAPKRLLVSSLKSLAQRSEWASSSSLQHSRGLLTNNGNRDAPHDEPDVNSNPSQMLSKRNKAAQAAPLPSYDASSSISPKLGPLIQIPKVTNDLYGSVSAVMEGQKVQPGVFKNEDGHRFDDGRYQKFAESISSFIPKERQFTDAVRTFAYGTDASFYRLNPKMVIKVQSEAEIKQILPIAKKLGVPITFRAAGTSLSGQAITDSVLLKLSHTGKHFRNYEVHGDGSQITVEPGLIGGEVNRILAAYKTKNKLPVQYKIGPDPSSIDSCMIGGIVSNNSSGMCCGVSQNTYHTLKDMRIVLVDGTVLDTADPKSCDAFLQSHKQLVDGVVNLAGKVQADRQLTALIRRKFAIKCTTGYSLNALVDFPLDSPIEIIKHLMIGSEGTLGFVSRATYNTVPEWPHKASAFIVFPDVRSACKGASILRTETGVDAVELFDRPSLTECINSPYKADLLKLVPSLSEAGPHASALLIECRGRDPETLESSKAEVVRVLTEAGLNFGGQALQPQAITDFEFKHSPKDYKVYWDVRKGLIPIVGAAREPGTSMLIEDVACPVDKLPEMMEDLVEMFQRYGYPNASCFGHALEGNLHLVFCQGFRNREEVQRFSDLMEEMCYIVATKHSGSLKGEHGTGRGVAPFVEMEWGSKAYDLMWELKGLFDPNMVLNPGVILNRDPDIHVKNLKPSPVASDIVNRCIECGFCESNCPSKDLTLTPRQRIAVFRELSRLRQMPNPNAEEKLRLKEMSAKYEYDGESTCAADGMCQEKCPVAINTGDLIKHIRTEDMKADARSSKIGSWLANNFTTVTANVPRFLNLVNGMHSIMGPSLLIASSQLLNRITHHLVPVWNPYMPKGASPVRIPSVASLPVTTAGIPRKVVYLPTCVTRMMGPAASDYEKASVHEKLMSIFQKADYQVIIPKNLDALCCGMMFSSRGLKDATNTKAEQLEAELLIASENGKHPIVFDTSPCLSQTKSMLSSNSPLKFSMYEPVEFIRTFLLDKLEFKKVRDSVAVHVPCSSKKMGIEESFGKVASLCANEVVPTGIPCCGMAGDRGMRFPELAQSSLQHLNLPSSCKDGYSTSRTCELNLSNHSGINFRGLVYLVDEATTPKRGKASSA